MAIIHMIFWTHKTRPSTRIRAMWRSPFHSFCQILSPKQFLIPNKNCQATLHDPAPWVEFLSGPGAWWGVPQETCLPLSGQQISWDTQVRTLQKRGIEHLGCAESGCLFWLFHLEKPTKDFPQFETVDLGAILPRVPGCHIKFGARKVVVLLFGWWEIEVTKWGSTNSARS